MIQRFSKLILVAMLSLTVGLHWGILQTVAWINMIATYSQEAPITVAVQQTFDGQHPCQLCKLVKTTQSTETNPDHSGTTQIKKLDFFVGLDLTPLIFLPPVPAPHNDLKLPFTSRMDAPPVPPPRSASSSRS